jgi:tRNA U34 5-methylaminomethyl-2-thiouridine-forming methyltransferase MnmC
MEDLKLDSYQWELQVTADGSHTLFNSVMDEHYHSTNGAVQESKHVFIAAGMQHQKKRDVVVFEVGFGTGLNAFLTLIEAMEQNRKVIYYSVERYPVDLSVVETLNYAQEVAPEQTTLYKALHTATWDQLVEITPYFSIYKIKGDSNSCTLPPAIDLIYFDAFAPDKQPEMWSQLIFDRLFAHTAWGGILTTYCAKGVVRRMMQSAGYSMERIPGPPGKREMLRATKVELE